MRRASARAAAALLVMGVLASSGAAEAAGDDTTVTAYASAARIGEGDSVTLTIEVKGSSPGRTEEPDLSGLADFTIAAGPSVSTSTSMLWRNGRATSTTSKQYSYVLLPRRRGALTIPTISVLLDGRRKQTNPISVEVVEGSGIADSSPGRRGRQGAGGLRERGTEMPEGEVFVESKIDKSEIYVGEQLLLTYKVYTQLELAAVPSPQRLASYTGFWVEEMPAAARSSMRRVERDGKEFLELTLMKKALFPTASGDLTIEESVFEVPVKLTSRDPFDSLFFTPTRTLYRSTKPLAVKVKPLPEKDRPESFSGAVGRYSLSVETDRTEVSLNDALGLTVLVTGAGNVQTVGEPRLPALPDYKKYDPRVESEKKIEDDSLRGWKRWDYVLTPLAPGQQDIPPIVLTYFDPEKETYVEVSSGAVPVRVLHEGGEPQAIAAGPPGTRREVAAFGRDIHYIKPVTELGKRDKPFHRSGTFAALMAAPVLLNTGILFFVKRRERLAANADLVRGRKAPAFARRRLRQARRLLAAEQSREFHREVDRALTGFLGDKLNMSPSGLTHEVIAAQLRIHRVDVSLGSDLFACLQACDYARYAPVAPGLSEMTRLLGDAEQVIGRLQARMDRRRAS